MGSNGIILVDKPEGWTSHDVVGKLRGILHERRIGHSGTLDPLATGLLVVFVGRATRAAEFAEYDSKEYTAGLRLGMSTDTQDISGNVLRRCDRVPDENAVNNALTGFRGDIEQLPPMYSAVKVNGKKLYELARKGQDIDRKPRHIRVSELEITGREGDDYILRICCSKGTYVRTLCNDIGEELGCGGCMSSLRRTRAGVFRLTDAHTLDEIAEAPEKYIIPLDRLFSELPALRASETADRKLRCGNTVKCSADEGRYRVYSPDGEFLLLGEVKDGSLRTIKNFFEVNDGK